jgi:prepilin-type N-terminal cleavage/methylation domain-containing protein
LRTDQRGFTMIELIAVLIVTSILFTVAIHKFGLFEHSASDQMVDHVISELNAREKLVWMDIKLTNENDNLEELVWYRMLREKDIGEATVAADIAGGTIILHGYYVDVVRSVPTRKAPAVWSRK